jgi:hypothetical protein
MDILSMLKSERAKLDRIIAMLESESTVATKTAAKPAKKSAGTRHQWTDAERKAMSLKQKALWAAKKKKKV